MLAAGPRTVTSCLRVLGLAKHPGFATLHRILNRNTWSGLALARVLVRMVVTVLVPSGPVIIGVDHTLERRRGPHIGPAGRFHAPGLRAVCAQPDQPRPAPAERDGAGGRAVRRPRLGLAGADPEQEAGPSARAGATAR